VALSLIAVLGMPLDAVGEGLKGARDRRCEIGVVGLNCDDVELVRQGLIITRGSPVPKSAPVGLPHLS
jgi:hypothetical protein